MNLRKLHKRIQVAVDKNIDELRGILLRKYPHFVFENDVAESAEIPVFVFHEVTNEVLEPLLNFLLENRYETLTADECLERLGQPPSTSKQRAVVLSFDDGHPSLYTEAYPALKHHGLKAVAYIVPGLTAEKSVQSDIDVCGWDQISEMHDSGTIDFQSHSMYRHSIPVSANVIDFARPGVGLGINKYRLVHLDGVASTIRESGGLCRMARRSTIGGRASATAQLFASTRRSRRPVQTTSNATAERHTFIGEVGGADWKRQCETPDRILRDSILKPRSNNGRLYSMTSSLQKVKSNAGWLEKVCGISVFRGFRGLPWPHKFRRGPAIEPMRGAE